MSKSKDCEKKTEEYKHNCDNIQIGIDCTDHICFFCDKCEQPLKVIEVKNRNVAITMNGKKRDNCTWVYLVCDFCKSLGQRKFYWTSESGKFCFKKTKRDLEEFYNLDYTLERDEKRQILKEIMNICIKNGILIDLEIADILIKEHPNDYKEIILNEVTKGRRIWVIDEKTKI